MKREQQYLVDYLFHECNFPQGCFLMKGAGIILPDEFTLQVGVVKRIAIEHVGSLVNFVGD